ncbi:MAG: hypothetical protein AB8B93_01530 [Pseudomonadales bacterium]
MADIHIDDFYRDTAVTLLHLYALFPRAETVFVEDIAGPEETDEFGLHSKRHLGALAAMIWLGDEGYLRHQGPIRQEALDQVVLTSRAFLTLNKTPLTPRPVDATDRSRSLIDEQQTNLFQLRNALKRKESATLRRAILDFMAQVQATPDAL